MTRNGTVHQEAVEVAGDEWWKLERRRVPSR